MPAPRAFLPERFALRGVAGLLGAGLGGEWYRLQGSNQGPLDPQSSALTN